MKSILLWLLIAMGPCFAFSQEKIYKSFPVAKGQTVSFNFDYPKCIQISTWAGKEIVVESEVNIDNGNGNHAFTITEKVEDGKFIIGNNLNMDLIPTRNYISINGNKIRFDSKEDMDVYIVQNKNENITSTFQTRDIEIVISIKVPVNTTTELVSEFGMVEVKNFHAPIKVNAKYGGIDASVSEKVIGKLQLTAKFGKIYSNLNFTPTEHVNKEFFTSITALLGKGPDYNFDSAFGNIYLRNAEY